MFIYPYKRKSNSVKVLKEKLGAKVIKLENSNFKGGDKFVLNWGNSTPNEEVEKCIVLNKPENVAIASNKKTFFNFVEGKCNIPPYTTEREAAADWVNSGREVVVREKLTGNSGEGIVILSDPIDFESYDHSRAKLYVQYIPKKQEYRVHIFKGVVVLTQRKAKPTGIHTNHVNYKIRSHDNGFIFVKNEGNPPDKVVEEAHKAVEACGLDFGAVDVIFNQYYDKAYVLEINTAPGLEGTTPDNYVEAIKAYANMFGDMEDYNEGDSNLQSKTFSITPTLLDHIQEIGVLVEDPEPDYDEVLEEYQGDDEGEEQF